jgi:hypothetical protein
MIAYRERVEAKTKAIERLVDEQNAAIDQLRAARSEAERLAAEAELKATQQRLAEEKAALDAIKHAGPTGKVPDAPAPKPEKKLGSDCDPNDPLGCIGK